MFGIPIYLLNALNQAGKNTSSSDNWIQKNSATEIFELKIPLALPYSNNWQADKDAEGLMEKDGEFYNVLKKSLKNDTLTISYAKNINAKEIFSLLSEYVEQSSDKHQDDNSQVFNFWSYNFKVFPFHQTFYRHFLFSSFLASFLYDFENHYDFTKLNHVFIPPNMG